jgi:hypothetical protein
LFDQGELFLPFHFSFPSMLGFLSLVIIPYISN